MFTLVVAAFTMSFLTYLINSFNINYFNNFANLLLSGFFIVAADIKGSNFLSNYSYLPILGSWAVIGLIVYLNYYFINLVYCEIYNYLVNRFVYINRENKENMYDLKVGTRLLVHWLIIVVCTIINVLIFVTFLPLGNYMREWVVVIFSQIPMIELFSYIISFIYWLFGFAIMFKILDAIKNELLGIELLKDHNFES